MIESNPNEINIDEAASWNLTNDGLYYFYKKQFLPVDAADLIKIEFKGGQTIFGEHFRLKPSEYFKEISFKRFPGSLFLKLIFPVNNKKPYIQICLKLQATEFSLDKLPTRDQMLFKSSWVPLYEDEVKSITDFVKKYEINLTGTISLKKAIDLLKSDYEYLVIINNEDPLNEREIETVDFDEISIPKTEFNATLYPYQSRGVQWMKNLFEEELGFVLADEMGLGKTIQIIALIIISRKYCKTPILIIAPATLLENWRREITKFAPLLKVSIHAGSGRTGFPTELDKHDVIITSYDIVVSDQSLFKMIFWSFAILDEAQAIKNPDTQRAKAVKSLNRKISIAVSGTPFENRLLDIWSIFDFTCQGILGDRISFERNFFTADENARKIEQIISPLILRRRVADVAKDLPEKIIIPEAIPMDDQLIEQYESLRREIQLEYGKNASIVTLIKLRQFCTHPSLLNNVFPSNPVSESNKYQRLIEILAEIFENRSKALIFTSFTLMSDIFKKDLSDRFSVPVWNIDGRTLIPDRQSIIDSFSAISGPAVLILNPKAAGTGLNITAANYVIHYNPEWNPATEDQATARAYRRGQNLPVFVYRLFYPDTIEDVMQDRMQRKRELSELAIVGTDASDIDSADIARALTVSPVFNK